MSTTFSRRALRLWLVGVLLGVLGTTRLDCVASPAASLNRSRARAMSGNAAVDVLAKTVFGLFEAWPRFKDIVYDELSAGASGALVLRGPLKMIQTIAMITQRGKATTTAERFKPLVSKSAWHAAGDALKTALEGVEGQEGLAERISELKANQFVCVIVFELEDGELRCQHNTGSGVASVEDRGPWE